MSDEATDGSDFARCFEALTGYTPLRWQVRLFDELAGGKVRSAVDLPTGLGKTSVITIWLIALASGAPLPRRLVYIVNRRTVVDQATDDAKRLLARLYRSGQHDDSPWATESAIQKLGLQFEPAIPDDHVPAMKHLRIALDARCTGEPEERGQAAPLAVSTLRGELADNGEWKKNPARPAIIIGTVDMIGSKLLFSGYGDGRYNRAHHAGLIGQDALIVHDEAHLEPAFDKLLYGVVKEQERTKEARPIRVMGLSATARPKSSGEVSPEPAFGLDEDDRKDAIVSQRLNARKSLALVDAEKGKAIDRISCEALRLGEAPSRVLVYVRTPDDAQGVRVRIIKGLKQRAKDAGAAMTDEVAATQVGLLTGTIRGHERDALAKGSILTAFRSDPDRQPPPESLFLVSTSAGEVGADWDADHLVCDLTTLDSMAQRFGRVNRLGGESREAQIVVVMERAEAKKKNAGESKNAENAEQAEADESAGQSRKPAANAYEAAVLKTGEILRGVAANGGDVSPTGLGSVLDGLSGKDKEAAFSPEPTILPATDILFDHWSLTSIGLAKGRDGRWRDALPGRPAVEPYLHGVADWEPPETHVAWRADISLLAAAGEKGTNDEVQPCSRDALQEVFDAFPMRSAEQLQDRRDRVQAELRKIAERLREEFRARASASPADDADLEDSTSADDEDEDGGEAPKKGKPLEPNPWVVLIRRGEPAWERLEALAPPDGDKAKAEDARRQLAFATVVLPVEVGGLDLKDGMLKGDEPAPTNSRDLDVAETAASGQGTRQRVLVQADESESALLGAQVIQEMPTKARFTFSTGDEDGDEPEGSASIAIEYRVAKGEAREPGERVRLDDHSAAVGTAAARMADALELSGHLKSAIALAGRLHDLGKGRDRWQEYANNPRPRDLNEPYDLIAKNKRYRDPRKTLNYYRHEFGSLLDAAVAAEVRNLDEPTRDLVLHLIAAHHGWARPHFEPKHFDPTAENEKGAVEAMQRFARLQQRYGRWGLAWLESLLRCADAAASKSGTSASPVAGNGGAP